MATATLKTLLLGEDRGTSKMLANAGTSAEKAKHGFANASIGLKDLAKGFIGLEVIGKATDFLKGSIAEARESQKTSAQTNAVLKSTGGVAHVTASQIGDLANAISLKTGIDDEAIQSSENLLLTFTNVRNEAGKGNDVFNQATQAVTDMSVAFSQSGKSSAIQLGKALSDPIKGVSALARVGVTFTDQQKKQIKTMVQSGHLLKAQKVILGALNGQVKGSAAAQATAGEKASVAWKNLQETIGLALLPTIDALENKFADIVGMLGQHVGPVLNTVGGFIKKNSAFLKPFAIGLGVTAVAIGAVTLATTLFSAALNSTGIPLVIVGIAGLIAGLVLLYQHSSKFRDIIATVGQIISTQVWPIMKKFGQFVVSTLIPAIVKIAQKVGQNLKPIFTQLATTFQTKVLPAMQKLFAKFQQWQPAIQKVIGFVVKMEGKWLEFQAKILGKVLPVVIKLIGWLIGKLVPAIITTVTVVAKIIGALVAFGGALVTAGQKVASFAGKVSNQIAKVVTFFVQLPGKVVKAVGNLGHLLWNAGSQIIQGLIDGVQSKINSLTSVLHKITSLIPIHKGPLSKDRKLLTPAGVAIMEGLIDGIESRKVRLTVALGKITNYIKAQNDKIKSLLSAKAGIVSALQGFSSSAFGASFTDAEGNDAPPTAAGLIGYQSQQLAQAQQLKADISKLLKMGLSKSLIMQLVNAGPSGMANIHALAQGSMADVAQLNSLNAQTNAALTSAGNAAGGSLYNAQIHDATKDRNVAQHIAHELEKMLHKQDKNTIVEIHLEGKTIQMSLLQLKRKNGGKKLGLT